MWINLHIELPDRDDSDYCHDLNRVLAGLQQDPTFVQGAHRNGEREHFVLGAGRGAAVVTIEYEPVDIRDERWRKENHATRVRESER